MNSIVNIRRHRFGMALSLRRTMARHLLCSWPQKILTYSSEYASVFCGVPLRLCLCVFRFVVNGGGREASCRMIHNGVSGKRIVPESTSFIRKSSGLAMAGEMFVTIVGDCRTHVERRRVRWND